MNRGGTQLGDGSLIMQSRTKAWPQGTRHIIVPQLAYSAHLATRLPLPGKYETTIIYNKTLKQQFYYVQSEKKRRSGSANAT